MCMLSTSRTGLAHACYLTAKARPEHTIESMAESKRRKWEAWSLCNLQVCSK